MTRAFSGLLTVAPAPFDALGAVPRLGRLPASAPTVEHASKLPNMSGAMR
jgi:hypothetical protein